MHVPPFINVVQTNVESTPIFDCSKGEAHIENVQVYRDVRPGSYFTDLKSLIREKDF